MELAKALENVLPGKQLGKVELIQELWAGYGDLCRIWMQGETTSYVVKHITIPEKPESTVGDARKRRSYQVEANFYKNVACSLPKCCRVPRMLYDVQHGDPSKDWSMCLVLEDLDSVGFGCRRWDLTVDEVKPVVRWLAALHKHFLQPEHCAKFSGESVWKTGGYWYLQTRQEEFCKMKDSDPLKKYAGDLNNLLDSCPWKTLLHGDAKVANFCFPEDYNTESSVAAVDFQYVGWGVGVRDLAYFLGSCWDDTTLATESDSILDYYFSELDSGEDLERSWRQLWPICFADFDRFLAGWNPTHRKRTRFAETMVAKALKFISDS